MRFFTSDTHFGHANIIKYCLRPFKDAGEMDREMVRIWNETVKKDDVVYHMGDVAFTSPDWCKHIIENLNGYKILILGNHDRAEEKMLERGFQEVHKFIKGLTLQDGTIVNLSHYPYRGTDDPHHKTKFDNKNIVDDGRLLLCGHVHDSWKVKPGLFKNHMINVGMDQWNFKPVSEDELIAFKETL
jgi:calcineurin-like phosphoesterase family protein